MNGSARLPSSGFCGWLGAKHSSSCPAGIVVDDQLDRIEHRDASLGALVQILAQAASSTLMSIHWCALDTPMRSANRRIDSGV